MLRLTAPIYERFERPRITISIHIKFLSSCSVYSTRLDFDGKSGSGDMERDIPIHPTRRPGSVVSFLSDVRGEIGFGAF